MKYYPLLFEPNLHTVVWGGNQLRPYKGLAASDEPVGESWEVSAVEGSVSIIANGEWSGRDLVSVINEHPKDILGATVNEKYGGKLPLLVKFIDARHDLSIQVHPNDEVVYHQGRCGQPPLRGVQPANHPIRISAQGGRRHYRRRAGQSPRQGWRRVLSPGRARPRHLRRHHAGRGAAVERCHLSHL